MGGTRTQRVQAVTPGINTLDSNRAAEEAQQDLGMKQEAAAGELGYRRQQGWSERALAMLGM